MGLRLSSENFSAYDKIRAIPLYAVLGFTIDLEFL